MSCSPPAPIVPEDLIQRWVVARMRSAYGRFWGFHVPNSDGRAGARNQARLGHLGVEKGIADLVIMVPPPVRLTLRPDPRNPGWDWWPIGAWLELKRKGNKATPEQLAWLDHVTASGLWAGAVTIGLEATWAQLLTWGYDVGPMPNIA